MRRVIVVATTCAILSPAPLVAQDAEPAGEEAQDAIEAVASMTVMTAVDAARVAAQEAEPPSDSEQEVAVSDAPAPESVDSEPPPAPTVVADTADDSSDDVVTDSEQASQPEEEDAAEVAQDFEADDDTGDDDYSEDEDDYSEDEEEAFRVDTSLITAEELARSGGVGNRKTEKDLKALNYDDPNSQLQDIPAVYVRREDGFGLRPNIGIRGANSERSKKITLMEDGILFAPAPYSAPAAYYFPIASRMVGIEVFKGPSAVRYGPHTVGGAVNWVTRPVPWDTAAGVDANFGSYLTGKAHAYGGTSWDNFGFLIEGVQWQSDGYKQLDSEEPAGFNKSEIMAKLRVNSNTSGDAYHAAILKLGFSRERSHETYLGLTDDDFAATPRRRYAASERDQMDWTRLQGQLRYKLEVGSNFEVDATVYRHNYDRVWDKLNRFGAGAPDIAAIVANPTGARGVYADILRGDQDSADASENLFLGRNDRSFVSQGVSAVSNLSSEHGSVENRLRVGLRLHHDRIERLHTEREHAMADGRVVPVGSVDDVTTHNIGRTLAFAAYLLDEIQFWRLVAAPGVRVELIDGELEDLESGETTPNFQTAVMPGIGLYGAITKEFGLLAGVHRGFSPVSPGQPEEVKPETSLNIEAGARLTRPSSHSIVEVVGFFNDYQNLLGECSFSAGCEENAVDDQFNAGAVWVYGAEVVAGHEFDAGSDLLFPIHGSYTLTVSEFRSRFASANPQFGDVEVGDELPYVPLHQASLRLGVQWKTLAWNVSATFVSAMREEAGQGDAVRTDEQYILDTLVSWNFWDGFTLYGKVDNVLNQTPIVSRRPFGARPSRPLMVQGGVRWEL